jgi:hypothetical protein
MGKMQRAKGAGFEVEVARMLRRAVYPCARRGLVQTRSATEDADVIGTPWWIEAKIGKNVSTIGAFKQARAATDGRPPLVVVRFDHEKPYVAMSIDDFTSLARDREVLSMLERGLCKADVAAAREAFDLVIEAAIARDDAALAKKKAARNGGVE